MPVKREFIIERSGKQFVLYAGLLDLAHEQGLKSIKTHLLQIPGDENGQTAICHAEVVTDRGTFSGLGDANPANVARHILPHLIRMAETRAKSRALRDSVNVGMCALEELGGDVEEPKPLTAVNATRPTPLPVNGTRVVAMAGRVGGASR